MRACSFEIDGSLTAMSLLRARPIAYGRGFRKRIFSGTSPRITSSTATESESEQFEQRVASSGFSAAHLGQSMNGHDDRGFRGASNLWLWGPASVGGRARLDQPDGTQTSIRS